MAFCQSYYLELQQFLYHQEEHFFLIDCPRCLRKAKPHQMPIGSQILGFLIPLNLSHLPWPSPFHQNTGVCKENTKGSLEEFRCLGLGVAVLRTSEAKSVDSNTVLRERSCLETVSYIEISIIITEALIQSLHAVTDH